VQGQTHCYLISPLDFNFPAEVVLAAETVMQFKISFLSEPRRKNGLLKVIKTLLARVK